MLPVEAQQRLMGLIPDQMEVAVVASASETRTITFDLTAGHVFWGYQDTVPEYPVIALSFATTGLLWEQGRTLDTLLRSVASDDGTHLTEYHGEPMYDDLQVTVAVDDAALGGRRLTKDQVARQMAGELYTRFVAADFPAAGDLDYEWPLRLEPITGPMHITRTTMNEPIEQEPDVSRWQFTIRVYYTLSWEVVVDTVDRLDIDIALDVDGDGDVETARPMSVTLGQHFPVVQVTANTAVVDATLRDAVLADAWRGDLSDG